MFDLLKASDGLIGHGTGNVNVNGRGYCGALNTRDVDDMMQCNFK
jgi:hypothetical protein